MPLSWPYLRAILMAPSFASSPELQKNADDNPETLRNRLAVYHRDTADLIPFYKRQGLLREVAGHGDIEEIYTSLTKLLGP